jgi:uncharacterized membrane protein
VEEKYCIVKFILSHSFTITALVGGFLAMRKMHLIVIGMLLLSCFAVNIIAPTSADVPRGTRSPDAGIEITAPSNNSGIPTEKLSYQFTIKNVGDEVDSFIVSTDSSSGWATEQSHNFIDSVNVDQSVPVTVNVTIPMGWPAFTTDILNLTVTSYNDQLVTEKASVYTTVDERFVVDIEIEGGTSWVSGVNPQNYVNYTLILRNKGNEAVTITLNFLSDNISWGVWFSRFPDVTVPKADILTAGINAVNITVTAGQNTPPNSTMNLTIWGEKSDVPWYSYNDQENITITTIVTPRSALVFEPETTEGFVGFSETPYNFTLKNTGNLDAKVDLIIDWPNILIVNLESDQMVVRVNKSQRNTLWVRTASDAPQGNYTINISAVDNSTGQLIAGMEVYYFIVPELNITNISVSDDEPMQYKSTNVYVTIENIGYVDARNATIYIYDGSKKEAEVHLDRLNASESTEVKIKWSPSEFGNRSIKISIDVEGEGNFTEQGTDIAIKFFRVNVKINWQPYYLGIYIIIVIILGIAVISSMITLKYYGGVPHLNDYGEGAEEMYDEEYPPDEGAFPEEEREEGKRPFGTYGVTTEPEQPFEKAPPYEPRRERALDYAPERRREPSPIEREPEESVIAPPRDPETVRKENELKDDIAKVQDKLDKTKSLGVDTSNIDQLLRTSKKSLSEGDLNKSKQYIGYASERIDNILSKRDEAQSAIKEAKEVLSGMRGSADMTIVENFLVKADSLFEEGDYREAINYANKAKERAVRLQRREMRL